MDALFGMSTKTFVILASDTFFRNNVVVSQSEQAKCTKVTRKSAVLHMGNQGDCHRLASLVKEILKMAAFADDLVVTERTISHLVQNQIYGRLRKAPVDVQCIIGGMEEGEGSLYMVDRYGAIAKGTYFSLGYASYFCYSAMDLKYRADLTEEEAIELIKEIYRGAKSKLVISYGDLDIKVITSQGIRDVVARV